MTEWNLSDKIVELRCKSKTNEMAGVFDCETVSLNDLKEFIRRLKDKSFPLGVDRIEVVELSEIYELAGEKLI